MANITAPAHVPAYFIAGSDGAFEPTPLAGGHWGESLISGPGGSGRGWEPARRA